MKRKLFPIKQQKKLTARAKMLFLAVMTLVAVVLLQWQPEPVVAQDDNGVQIATGSSWQGASFPVEAFQSYSSPFGYRTSPTGEPTREFHSGLDIVAPMGSYVRNWWSGKVVAVVNDDRCGVGLVVESGAWEHIYCHMLGDVNSASGEDYLIDREGGILIRDGQYIPAGARIGRVGMSGRSTGPHLHWGMRYNGEWYDPALVLRAMYGEQSQVSQNQ